MDMLGRTPQKKKNIPAKKKEVKKPVVFSPSTFTEYIGQDNIKDILKQYIQSVQKRGLVFPHTLISGEAGTGKTTLAKILANELKAGIVETITSEIKDYEDLDKLIKKTKGGILLLDEIHGLDRDNGEKIYTIMTHFRHNDRNIKPFTVVGATTELGELIKSRKPLVERFKLPIELEKYLENDLVTIAKQYKKRLFSTEKVNEDSFILIAKNSRGIPRTVERLLEATIHYEGDLRKVLRNFGIIKDGYTLKDLKVLKYLLSNVTGVGLQGIGSYLGTSTENYLYQIEPFLLQNKLITRTSRGRKITNEGLKKITELEGELN